MGRRIGRRKVTPAQIHWHQGRRGRVERRIRKPKTVPAAPVAIRPPRRNQSLAAARAPGGGAGRTSNVDMDSLTDGVMIGKSQLTTIPSRDQKENISGQNQMI